MKPKIKQIKHVDDVDDDPEGCFYYLSYAEDMHQIMLTLQAKRPMTPEEYLEALSQFVNNMSENPEELFVDTIDHEDNLGVH